MSFIKTCIIGQATQFGGLFKKNLRLFISNEILQMNFNFNWKEFLVWIFKNYASRCFNPLYIL